MQIEILRRTNDIFIGCYLVIFGIEIFEFEIWCI